ncbi:MAG: 1,4-dihydroxy-2-naphthoate octaprenyltransferase [Fidelibacterota bacterium]
MGFYRNWFLASRPWSLTMTFVSIAVGFVYASAECGFSISLFLLTLIAGVLVHLGANLMNDYFDVKNGVDFDSVLTAQYRPHPLVEGKIELKSVLRVSVVMFLIAAMIGLYLVITRGFLLLWIGLAGLFLAIAYTAPPFKYKYKGLGEIGVLLIWGPLMTAGSYYIQTLSLNWEIIVISVPIGLLVALVLLINNIRDRASDGSQSIKTLPVVFSKQGGLHIYTGIIILAYLWIIVISLFGPLTVWSLLVLLSCPLAFKMIKQMYQEIPDDADAETAKLDTLFGVLLLVSIILGNYVG